MDKKQDEVIVIDDDWDDPEGNLVQGICVKEDPMHVHEPRNKASPEEEVEKIGRSRKKNIPRTIFSPRAKGETKGDKITTGVGTPTQ